MSMKHAPAPKIVAVKAAVEATVEATVEAADAATGRSLVLCWEIDLP